MRERLVYQVRAWPVDQAHGIVDSIIAEIAAAGYAVVNAEQYVWMQGAIAHVEGWHDCIRLGYDDPPDELRPADSGDGGT